MALKLILTQGFHKIASFIPVASCAQQFDLGNSKELVSHKYLQFKNEGGCATTRSEEWPATSFKQAAPAGY